MKEVLYRQIKVNDGQRKRVTNVRDHPKVSVGNRVQLREEDGTWKWWNIDWVANAARPRQRTDWNNNI